MNTHPMPPRVRRGLGVTLLALVGTAPLVLVAAVPHVFLNDTVASADAVNENFTHVTDRLDAGDQRNLLLNGNFDVWQRGTTFGSAGVYTADRWVLSAGTASRETANVPTGSLSALNLNGALEQRLENLSSVGLEGRQATFAVLVKCATGSVSVRVFQHATPNVMAGRTSAFDGVVGTCDGTFKRYSHTFAVTTGMAKNGLSVAVVANGVLAQAMLHEGSMPARFRTAGRHPAGELALCQRYFEVSDRNTFSSYGTNNRWNHWTFHVTKRVAPTVTFTPYEGTALESTDPDRAQFLNSTGPYAGFGNGKADAEIY